MGLQVHDLAGAGDHRHRAGKLPAGNEPPRRAGEAIAEIARHANLFRAARRQRGDRTDALPLHLPTIAAQPRTGKRHSVKAR
ncbi:MAG: hypothetical protein OXP69_04580 [Spirochaetaceae bacterium]|nr:hypothetical protein [Spirochaetaceae bacterium]